MGRLAAVLCMHQSAEYAGDQKCITRRGHVTSAQMHSAAWVDEAYNSWQDRIQV
jgi:hypothetical protein